MRRCTILSVMAAIVFSTPSSLRAQAALPCLSESGEKVLIPVIYTHPGDFAKTRTLPNPVMYVDPEIQMFTNAAQMLIFDHECHHATHTYINEDEADVYAGMLMRMNGISSDITKAAASEVFRWTTINHGHSIPAVRVELVMKGYSSAGPDSGDKGTAQGDNPPIECVVTDADLDDIDVSDAVPDYAKGSRIALQRRLTSQQKLLDESIKGCAKAVESLRRHPGDSDFMQYVRDSKNDIARHLAYIREVKKALRAIDEQ